MGEGQGEGEQDGASPLLEEGARGRPDQNDENGKIANVPFAQRGGRGSEVTAGGATPKAGHNAEIPQRYQLTPVPPPESHTSFQTACRAIAAVRKAKHEAQIGLGKPLATLTITATQDQLDSLKLIASDVADAGRSPPNHPTTQPRPTTAT